jgi:hypothetical protein
MARYLLVEVDENDRAIKLMEKLNDVTGLRVIGLFGKPTQFCECEGPWENSIRGKKYGWYVCPSCGNPRPLGPHQRPRNLLEGDTPETMQNVFLSIREPYQTAEERHGTKAIEKLKESIRRTRLVIKQYNARNPRRKRRSRARRF